MRNAIGLSALAFAASATAAAAQIDIRPVPEIDALAGVSAVAAVGGAIALVRERYRRK